MRWLVGLVLVTSVSAAVAEGPSTEDLFKEFGLFGTGAVDCQLGAGPDNPHVKISIPSHGLILEDHDLGLDNTVNRYSILSAAKLSNSPMSRG